MTRLCWLLLLTLAPGCAAQKAMSAEMAPLALAAAPEAAPPPAPLKEDHFTRDQGGALSESALRTVLDAPVYLEAGSRLGVVPVASSYAPEEALPLPALPAELTRALEESGQFEAATEVSTDWPADRGLVGLRELAARYRCDYLLLYRQRFVADTYSNGYAWLFPTLIGLAFVPGETLETQGVLEATLFDVRSGTLLFTAFERVKAARETNLWHQERKLRDLQAELLSQAATRLADQVTAKVRRLAALRPPAAPPNAVAGFSGS